LRLDWSRNARAGLHHIAGMADEAASRHPRQPGCPDHGLGEPNRARQCAYHRIAEQPPDMTAEQIGRPLLFLDVHRVHERLGPAARGETLHGDAQRFKGFDLAADECGTRYRIGVHDVGNVAGRLQAPTAERSHQRCAPERAIAEIEAGCATPCPPGPAPVRGDSKNQSGRCKPAVNLNMVCPFRSFNVMETYRMYGCRPSTAID
jgi:hypothetical protein